MLETLPEPGSPGISVVVPVHDAPLPLEACLEALAQHTTCPARLLLLDDASADPRVAEILARWAARPGVAVHRNATNLGFAGTCNRGFALAGRDDVVLLNADTEVGPGWLEGLRLAAYASRATGTATAVSDHAGPFSVPEPYLRNARPPGFAAADLARLVRQASPALLPVVPTGHGFCLYLRRDCLDQVGGFDAAAFPRGYGEENDFCLRAGRAGWVHRVDDRTWVRHHGGTSFGTARAALQEAGQAVLEARYPEYPHLTATLDDDPGLLALRWRVRRALGAARGAPRPRVLFVLATRTGGTPQTNRDLMAALADRYEPWTLHSDGRELELAGQDGTVVERRRLPRPLTPAIHASPEYDAAVADLLVRHGFELVHVRHLAWHGLGLTAACRRLGVPVVFSFHDFYAVCPTVKLLDEKAVFCGGACTPTPGDCTAELWPPEAVPPLKHRFVHRWKAMMAAALRPCDAFVTTSPRAQATLLDNFPFLARRDFRVIPHGRDFARFGRPVEPPVDRERLRVLVPGNISAAKGAGLVAAMAALDGGEAVEFHVLGDPGTIPAGPGTVLHGRYDRAAFAARARRIRPHLGTVLSLWPETWCHTLTELWASGLPVLALDTGAPGERLRAHGGGWLLPADAAPQQLLDALLRLRRNPEEVRARTAQVLAWQRGEGRYYGTAAMAVEYDLLYRAVLARRRAFADPRAVVPPPSGPRGVPPSPQPA